MPKKSDDSLDPSDPAYVLKEAMDALQAKSAADAALDDARVAAQAAQAQADSANARLELARGQVLVLLGGDPNAASHVTLSK